MDIDLEERKYVIIEASKIKLINFKEVLQTGADHMRFSLDGSKTLVKYKGDMPEFIFDITEDAIGLEEHTHKEMIKILGGPEWTKQD